MQRPRRPINRCAEIDTHEIMKQEIYKQAQNDETMFRAPMPPALDAPLGPGGPSRPQPPPSGAPRVGFEDIWLYFDSIYRNSNVTSALAGELRWAIPPINNNNDVQQCVQIRIGPMYFPKINSAAGKPEFFYYRKVFMEIQSAPTQQAVLGGGGNRYHFEFDVENINGQAVRLVPLDSSFYFRRPIVAMTDFQVRFTVPMSRPGDGLWREVPIPSDTVNVVMLLTGGVGYNPIRFRIVNDTTATLGPTGVLTSPGLAVFGGGFISNDTTVDDLVNAEDGVYVTNIINDTDFEIGDIDGSTVTTASTAAFYIPKNRIAFSVRFTTVQQQATNHIVATHS